MRIRMLAALAAVALVAIGVVAGFGRAKTSGEAGTPFAALGLKPGITEDNLPPGFSKNPAVEINGKRWRFDAIPGHYWKVLDKRGFAVGLHFQALRPFPWAKGVPKGELLYLIYAIPGNCGDGSYAKAVRSPTASIYGKLPPGFDHWHAYVGAGSKVGNWYVHIPVRDFVIAGPKGNPLAGTKIVAGTPRFIPVCDIR